MKQTKSEFVSCEEGKSTEKTPLLGLHYKMSGDTGYTKFCDEDCDGDGDNNNDNDYWWNAISSLCSCDFWWYVLMFIVFPLAIYYYRADIQNYYYAWRYGKLPNTAAEPKLGPKVKRLKNLGNTCFFNSMNQSVNQTVLLHRMLTDHLSKPRKYILKPDKGEELSVQIDSTELTGLTKEAHDLYCIKIATLKWDVAVPRGLLRELSNRNQRFGRRKEEDSHEALRCLLDGLRMEEIDRIKDQIYAHYYVTKDSASQGNIDGEDKLKLKMYLREAAKQCLPVDTVFGGIQVSTTICRECYTPLQNEEKFFDISLPLPENLAETIGNKGSYQPPVSSGHDGPNVKESSFDGKESPQGESPDEKAADDVVHEKQVVSQDQTHDMPPDNQDAIPLTVTDHASKLEDESDKEDTSNIDICQPNDVENEHDEFEDGKSDTAVDLVSQFQGEEHEQETNNANDTNTQPDVNDDPETLPSEEGVTSQEKTDHQDLSDVNRLNDAENLSLEDKPNPDVALRKAELLKFLESKDLLYQTPAKCEEERDPQSLEAILTEYTALDILDEDNKFICKTCSTKAKMVKGDDGGDDDMTLCLVSKQIAIHRLPPVLILHLKRFSIEPDGVFKDNQHIKFPFKLNITPYCTTQCIKEMGDCKQEIWYGLYAVVVHEGKTLEHGHYFAYVRRRPPMQYSSEPDKLTWMYDQAAAESGHWFYASDLTVHYCDRGFDEVREQRAYMLFYEILPKIDCD